MWLPSIAVGALTMSTLSMAACRRDMQDQPRYKPLAATDFFGDGRSARPLVEGTVAREDLRIDTALFTGKVGDTDVDTFPFPITRASMRSKSMSVRSSDNSSPIRIALPSNVSTRARNRTPGR